MDRQMDPPPAAGDQELHDHDEKEREPQVQNLTFIDMMQQKSLQSIKDSVKSKNISINPFDESRNNFQMLNLQTTETQGEQMGSMGALHDQPQLHPRKGQFRNMRYGSFDLNA